MGKIIKNKIEYTGGGDTIQVSQLPVASADELGKIYQYIGATDATYTNGYFYKCEEVTPATDPKTYKWTNIQVQQGGSGGAEFELDTTNDFAVISNQNQAISFQLDDADGVTMIASDPGTYYNSKILSTQDYVDNKAKAEILIEDGQEATIRNSDEPNNYVYFGFGEDNGVNIVYKYGEQRKDYFTWTGTQIVDYVDSKAGINLAVGKEKWYGTYEDENGEVFQVYSKTVYIPALPSTAGITQYNHGVANIKQILSIYGFTTDGFVLNAPRQVASDNISIYQASKSASNQTFSIEVGKDRSSKKAYVTMIYAKNNP